MGITPPVDPLAFTSARVMHIIKCVQIRHVLPPTVLQNMLFLHDSVDITWNIYCLLPPHHLH
jgi:hypothetical protein